MTQRKTTSWSSSFGVESFNLKEDLIVFGPKPPSDLQQPYGRRGRAPRAATNAPVRGSRRCSDCSRGDPDDDPSEPEPHGARYLVKLRGGRRSLAVDVDPLATGWLRALIVRTRVEYDEDLDVGRPVVHEHAWKLIPPDSVVEVVELDTPPWLDTSSEGTVLP